MTVDLPGQNVLERTSVLLAPSGDLEARFTIALPAKVLHNLKSNDCSLAVGTMVGSTMLACEHLIMLE